MEALLFMFNSIAVVVMVFMGLRDDRRAPGMRQTSIFRTIEDDEAPPAAPVLQQTPQHGPLW